VVRSGQGKHYTRIDFLVSQAEERVEDQVAISRCLLLSMFMPLSAVPSLATQKTADFNTEDSAKDLRRLAATVTVVSLQLLPSVQALQSDQLHRTGNPVKILTTH
jgi:hypothetical protein